MEEITKILLLMERIDNNQYVNSPMNYAGSKYRILKQILPLFPSNIGTFIDLFAGGGNVGANVNAKKVIYNDKMGELIDLYKQWKSNGVEKTINDIEQIINKYGLGPDKEEEFYKFREKVNNDIRNNNLNFNDLYVLLAHSFNNMVRFNKNGEYNASYGKGNEKRKSNYFNDALKKKLKKFIECLMSQESEFLKQSFDVVDSQLNPDVIKNLNEPFVYADPPYLITGNLYSGWDETMEKKLIDYLDKCNKNGIRFAMSNVLQHQDKYGNIRTNDILLNWIQMNPKYNVHHLDINYSNSCGTKSKKIKQDVKQEKSDEVLITNY
jgi:DNA adenine methylase Dam